MELEGAEDGYEVDELEVEMQTPLNNLLKIMAVSKERETREVVGSQEAEEERTMIRGTFNATHGTNFGTILQSVGIMKL